MGGGSIRSSSSRTPAAIHLNRRDRRSPIIGHERRPFTKIYNSGWKLARVRMVEAYRRRFEAACESGEQLGQFEYFLSDGLINVRVHDLRHTFGQRLRAMGATLEVRQDLLGHKSGRITTEVLRRAAQRSSRRRREDL